MFDIQNCNFSKKNMKKKQDGDINKSKDGTGKDKKLISFQGRVAMFSQYGVVRSYTIEANYNMCNRLNKRVYEEYKTDEKQIQEYLDGSREPFKEEVLPNIGQLCRNFDFETQPAKFFFRLADFEEMGREVGIGLLDLIDMNPLSRIRNTPLKNMRVKFF